jgi:hypothetical protein
MPVHVLTDSEYRDFLQMRTWIRGFSVSGGGATFKNSPSGATLALPDKPITQPVGIVGSFFFPVLVSAVAGGSAGPPATYTYNVYRLSDTGYGNALTSSALTPESSVPRMIGVKATVAAAGSVGIAYFATSGNLALKQVDERAWTTNCA